MSESRSDVITLGPFTTSEDTAALCVQVRQGLEQLLGGWEGELPFSLSDIRVEAMARVYALAATTEASLRAFAGKSEKSPATSGTADREENDARGTAPKPLRRHGASARVPRSSEGPAHLAALLASGDASAVKLVVRGILDEASKAGKRSIPESRARTLALATAVLVASEASGHQTERAWPALDDLLRAVNAAESKAELSKAALRFLKTLMPQTLSKTKDVAGADPALNRAIRARLPGRVLLGEVAKELGRTPGALSHYLRRKYGLTFSDYVGRLRVEEAKRLIRETQLGAGEVGIRVGIVDQSNFAKLFKKVAGCSPREYRLLHGRNR
jgi:AraC-like DNA-binding protein